MLNHLSVRPTVCKLNPRVNPIQLYMSMDQRELESWTACPTPSHHMIRGVKIVIKTNVLGLD